jgi:hypothetical protein
MCRPAGNAIPRLQSLLKYWQESAIDGSYFRRLLRLRVKRVDGDFLGISPCINVVLSN